MRLMAAISRRRPLSILALSWDWRAMTYTRALQIRRLATELPLTALVLETDAPDMSPSWIPHAINTPAELPAIAAVLAGLRGVTPADISMATTANAQAVLPRMRRS
jgi:TatD DNase family protein